MMIAGKDYSATEDDLEALSRHLAEMDHVPPDASVIFNREPQRTSIGPIIILADWEMSSGPAWKLYQSKATEILQFQARHRSAKS